MHEVMNDSKLEVACEWGKWGCWHRWRLFLCAKVLQTLFYPTRKIDYWLTFVETHRLPGASPPRVTIIGSHYDLLKKKTQPEEYTGFIARLENHTRSRLKQSKLCLDGFFAIDCR